MTAAPVRCLSIDEFFAEYSDREGERWELVAGVPVMSPTESPTTRATAFTIGFHLRCQLGTEYHFEPDSDVFLPPTRGRDTVRIPDLLVRRRVAGVRPEHGDRSEVVLVVEVVSPGSVRTDRVTKRREYAAAGIPNYLIVDVRDETPTLTLYDTLVEPTDPAGAAATTYPRYADATGDGTSVTLHIDGHAITLTAAELADAL